MEYVLPVIAVGIAAYFGFLFWQVTHLRRVTWHLLRDYDTLGQWLHAGANLNEHQIYARLLSTGGEYADKNGYEPKLSFDSDFRQVMLSGLLEHIQSGLNLLRLRYAIPVSAAIAASYFMQPSLPFVCLAAFVVSGRAHPNAAGRNALFVHMAAMTYMLHRWDSLDEESCRRFVDESPLFDPLYRQMKRLSQGLADAA